MTTYKGIRGQTIRTIAGDASPLIVGDIWYSTATRKIRGAKLAAGAWASGGNMTVSRNNGYSASRGSLTAGLVAGGNAPGGLTTATELYNGTAWTTSPASLPEACYAGASCGTQTAALQWKGATGTSGAAECFEFDGSSWTDGGDFPKSMQANAGTGTQTAALGMGGSGPYSPITATYDGSSWTVESNNLNTSREYTGAFGIQTAAICAGGNAPVTVVCEKWNGTAWTEVGDMNTGRYSAGYSGDTEDSGLVFGGGNGSAIGNTEEWDGSSWAEGGDLSTARSGSDGFGTATSSVCCGGVGGINTTEEWTKAVAASSFTSS